MYIFPSRTRDTVTEIAYHNKALVPRCRFCNNEQFALNSRKRPNHTHTHTKYHYNQVLTHKCWRKNDNGDQSNGKMRLPIFPAQQSRQMCKWFQWLLNAAFFFGKPFFFETNPKRWAKSNSLLCLLQMTAFIVLIQTVLSIQELNEYFTQRINCWFWNYVQFLIGYFDVGQ